MLVDNKHPVDRTAAIEKVPHQPGLIGSMNLFGTDFVSSDSVIFDVRENSFHILSDTVRNTEEVNSTEGRPFKTHVLPLYHYPIEKSIGAEKLRGIRGFNKDTEETIGEAVAGEIVRQAGLMDHNEEYLKAQAVVNGVAVSEVHGTLDMEQEFGAVRPTVNVGYAQGETKLALREAIDKAKKGLTNGGQVGGYFALVTPEMFADLVDSPDLIRSYEVSQSSGTNPLVPQLGEIGNGYHACRWGNVTIVAYDDTFTTHDGQTVNVLTEGGILIPRTQLGRIFYGPSSTLSGLNSGGAKRFAASYRDPRDRFVTVSSETTTLPLVTDYAATVKLVPTA